MRHVFRLALVGLFPVRVYAFLTDEERVRGVLYPQGDVERRGR